MVRPLTIRKLRRTLWLLAAAAVVSAFSVLMFGLTRPYSLPGPDRPVSVPELAEASHESDAPALEHLSEVWALNLQRPLYDPPKPVIKKKEFKPPPLAVRLLGTVIEPGNSQAILMARDGQIHFMRAGDELDHVKIEAVEPTQVRILYYDQPQTLSVEEGA